MPVHVILIAQLEGIDVMGSMHMMHRKRKNVPQVMVRPSALVALVVGVVQTVLC